MSEKDNKDTEVTRELGADLVWRDKDGDMLDGTSDGSFSLQGSFLETIGNIGRYVDLQKLGQGSFGIVFRAQDDVLKRFVALKLLTQFKNAGQVDAWVAEARVLASLDHPAIVPVYDIGKTDAGQPYIVSKLIDGGCLSERAGSKTWAMHDSVRVVHQLAQALDYLHHQGVMHRDIKPANILTTSSGDAVLADFGLALPESSYGKGARFVGTPAYMSPEQARHEGHRVDGRSDIYSLGVVFYELLSGTRPFRVKNQEELLDCIRNVEVRPIRQLNSEIPKELERICLKMLSKKVSDRYSTAADLSEDLENWKSNVIHSLRSKESAPSISNTALPSAAGTTLGSTDPSGSTNRPASTSVRSLDIETIAVVPHGLRPFDASDSDFFKYLLPGAKDRDGVPDSISFWVNRIVARKPEESFRVGVLLGPSGSGKSSLMRAGILPMVGDDVTTVYVEAKPDQLEENLLKQIRQSVPSLANARTLRECLIQARQNGNDRKGNKLLLVIDQFEQWLNYHRDTQATDLHEALRQCDGANVQAILLVRDDFMLGISSFMDQIEELLLQNQNFATIEPFGVLHARNVLAAFGRAYGTLSDPLTSDQSAFIKEATSGLEQIGRLEPVQIALLSEMIKGRLWTPATLKELGGIQGLGVSFLEERLAGPSAHPLLRSQLPIVRRILTELLPADDTVIKPPACAQSVLLDRLEGIASEETLRKLLSLIDTEVRLITPTSNASTNSSNGSSSSTTDPAYQLTHDYLVPTTRKWLALLEVETRSGRARQQLREVSSAWNAKPTAKRLPSLTEWANIRWFTSPSEWSASERRMMQSARRRLTLFATLGTIGLFALLGLGYLAYFDTQSRFFAKLLVEADTSDVVSVLHEIEPIRPWVLPKLAAFGAAKEGEDTGIEVRKQLHIALAMADQADQANSVFEKLHTIDDRNLAPIVTYLSSRKSIDEDKLFEQTQNALNQKQANALPMVAILCQRNPEHAQWESLATETCELLLRKPSTLIGFWPEMLMPIRKHLLPVILKIGERDAGTGTGVKETAVSLVSAFAKGNESSIAIALGWSPPEQLSLLLNSTAPSNTLATEIRQQLSKARSSIRALPTKNPDAQVERLVGSYGGHSTSQCAWADQIPWARLTSCIEEMRSGGFRPISLRPYMVNDSLNAAVAWVKETDSDRKFVFETELTEKALQSKFVEMQEAGFVMDDFCEYRTPNASGEEMKLRWTGIWHKAAGQDAPQQALLIHETGMSRFSKERQDRVAGLVRAKYAVRLDPKGELIHHSLWTASSSENATSTEWSRLGYAAGDLFPGYCQTDLRCVYVGQANDRSTNWQETYGLERRNANEAYNLAGRLSACGEFDDALEIVTNLTEADFLKIPEPRRSTIRRATQRQQARALARLGKKEELRTFLDKTISDGKFTQEEKDFLYLRLAILEDDESSAIKLLSSLEAVADTKLLSQDYYLRSLALVASKNFTSDASAAALQKLIAMVPKWIAKESIIADTLLEADFDVLKAKPEWQQLLNRCNLVRRFSSCLSPSEQIESKALYATPISEHARAADKLCDQGYEPACLDVSTDSEGKLFVSSVWHRPKLSAKDIAANARRTAIYALALAKLGETDALSDAISEKWGRSVQTAIIALSPQLLSADALVSMLRKASDFSVQSAIVATLGNYPPTRLNDVDYRYVLLRLSGWAAEAPESKIRNMARWCLQNWNEKVPSEKPSMGITPERNWFTNSMGQQMIIVVPPDQALLGRQDERRMWIRIGRQFAISATEVTGFEFEEFLKDPRVKAWIDEDRRQRLVRRVIADHPQTAVSWQMAIRYCQWLNEREKIPEDQWCYKDVWKNDGNLISADSTYLEHSGYRLPTHAEWEWACTEALEENWHFGSDETMVKYFDWTSPDSNNSTQPVGRLRPNNLGLFDMSGNVAEWSDDYGKPRLRHNEKHFLDDIGNLANENPANRILCGGRFKLGPGSAFSTAFTFNAFDYRSNTTGFRIARTISSTRGVNAKAIQER